MTEGFGLAPIKVEGCTGLCRYETGYHHPLCNKFKWGDMDKYATQLKRIISQEEDRSDRLQEELNLAEATIKYLQKKKRKEDD